jgi:mercuric ion transport protein
MRIELIYDTDCPNVAETRGNLLQAFAAAHLEAKWTEWDRSSPLSPAYAHRFGSPTVLVEGLDVAGDNPRDDISCCRLYTSSGGRYTGAPSVELIKAAFPPAAPSAVMAGTTGLWKQGFFAVPGIVVSFLPFGSCPLCWPVYAGVLSSLGLGFLLASAYLLPLTVLFLFITVFTLAFRARARRGYGPFAVGVVAATLTLWFKFSLESNVLAYVGVGLLIASSLWNSWPRRAASQCPRCAPAGNGLVQMSAMEKSNHHEYQQTQSRSV